MERINVLFLVEAGSSAGFGHLRRMQVLSAALSKEGWNCNFGINDPSGIDILKSDGLSGKLWSGNGLNLGSADVLIVDGYQYSTTLFQEWKNFCKVSVVVDDIAERPVEADILLNHNIYGNTLDYSRYKIKSLLVGPDFSLVDSRFLDVPNYKKPPFIHILVTFGGTDYGLLSAGVVSALLHKRNNIIVEVVTTPLHENSNKLTELATKFPDRLIVHKGIDMCVVMGRCSFVVGSAGFTVIEALAAGLTPIVCAIVDNQKFNINALKKLGVKAHNKYDSEWLVNETLSAIDMSKHQKLPPIDGQGVQRVVMSIKEQLSKVDKNDERH